MRMVSAVTRDPNSYIAQSAEHLAETLTKKNSDYAPTDEFSNFRKSAEAAGITVIQLITAQIAIKMTRVEKLMQADASAPRNESLKDSFLDLAGYAAIGHAWLSFVESDADTEPFDYVATEDREGIRNSADDVPAPHHHIWSFGGTRDDCVIAGCFAIRDKGVVHE